MRYFALLLGFPINALTGVEILVLLLWLSAWQVKPRPRTDVRKTGFSPINAENNRGVTNDVMFTHADEKINILLSVLSMFFLLLLLLLLYDFNLNTQGFVYLEFVKYQRGIHRNVQVFAKCNVCISAIHLLYIKTCPIFLPTSKLIVYISDVGLTNIEY